MRTSFIWTVIHNGDFFWGGLKWKKLGQKKSRLQIFEFFALCILFSKLNPNSPPIKYLLIFEPLNFGGISVQYIVKWDFLRWFFYHFLDRKNWRIFFCRKLDQLRPRKWLRLFVKGNKNDENSVDIFFCCFLSSWSSRVLPILNSLISMS